MDYISLAYSQTAYFGSIFGGGNKNGKSGLATRDVTMVTQFI